MLASFQLTVNGVILYSGSNDINLTAPDAARENVFNSVGRIANSSQGSVVHIRGKYLLTADHVNVNTNSVTFDGVTSIARDTQFAPIQIAGSDMKLIKLLEDPGLPETELLDNNRADIAATGTLIGWGVGRDESVDDPASGAKNTWEWGNSGTMSKRWGTNRIDFGNFGEIADYEYNYLQTDLDSNAGNDEAGLTIYDSGSGLFVNHNGTWKLAGISAAVSTSGSCTFAFIGDDLNYFVRVSSYIDDIEAAIPDPTIYSDWKIENSLYNTDAFDTADTDGDGVPQLLEFAFGGNPHQSDAGILPIVQQTQDGDSLYLELKVTRPIGLSEVTYTPMTTDNVTFWPTDSAGIYDSDPASVNNGDGTETLIYRRSTPIMTSTTAFIRISVSTSTP
ncbi:MAG: hypothetical protein AAF065_01135 [Verrucomicrobiota bacterium]